MLRFRTTENILKDRANKEHFDPNWLDVPSIEFFIGPPKSNWSYKREMTIEDVDVWEVIHEENHGLGVYAAWSPYAEFYMITAGYDIETKSHVIETYYGGGSQYLVQKRIKELNFPVKTEKTWVDDDKVYMYVKPDKVYLYK
jgi:hypothetical protein